MGLTWCRERIEQAHNSKSPVDRILVCCSNAIKPKSSYSHSQGKIVNDFVYKGMRSKDLGISHPVPVHAVPPRTRNRTQKLSDWHTCTLTVPDSGDSSEPPVPPPRKKRKRRLNSLEVLNNQLPELHSPSYVRYSENLLSKNIANDDSTDLNETDVLRPLEKSFRRERISACDRFEKLSGSHARKIKTEFHPNDVKEKRVKNDNEKRSEQKIKHVSTVSLPNYNELIKPSRNFSTDVENSNDKTGNQSVRLKHPRRNSSTISLPGEGSNSILSSLSEATIARLEAYLKRCRSFGALKPQQLLEKLEEFHKTHRSSSESSDSWCGLDDWDLGVIEYCSSEQAPPLTPKSTLPPKREREQNESVMQKQKEIDESKTEEEEATYLRSEPPIDRTPIVQRSVSIIEGVPIEWFLDPSLRAPAIMPPPLESQKFTKTPPPSPENEDEIEKETDTQLEEHSSLLNILRQYKDDEGCEPEVQVDVTEIVSGLDPSENESLSFEEVDVRIPITETLNPFLPVKNRSTSLAGEQLRLLQEESRKLRSPSIGYESSANLIHKLQSNEGEIEKEILLKPNELIQGLRRESLCESLPEDAFEAYVNKIKPLKESLNEFLGFQDEIKRDDEKFDKNFIERPKKDNEEEKADVSGGRKDKDEINDKDDDVKEKELEIEEKNEEKLSQRAPPLPTTPAPIALNPSQTDTNTPVPNSLVE